MFAPAPALPPVTLESAFIELQAADLQEDPISILRRAAPSAQKLAALETLHSSLPLAPQPRRTQVLEAIRLAALSSAEAPAVRAKAMMYLGYAVPLVGDEKARDAAVRALIDSTVSSAYRVFALRGLTSAAHNLPEASEGPFQATILDLLGLKLTEEERITALVTLDSFLRSSGDLPRRRPDLVGELEKALLVPIEAGPAAFAAKGSPNVRMLTLTVVWRAARSRAANGEAAALDRVNALLTTLAAHETNASVKAQIAAFLAAEPPKLIP